MSTIGGMDVTPQLLHDVEFREAKRGGYNTQDVDEFLEGLTALRGHEAGEVGPQLPCERLALGRVTQVHEPSGGDRAAGRDGEEKPVRSP